MSPDNLGMPFRTRQGDPPGSDPRPKREPNPALWDWEAAYGKAVFRGRGLLLAIIVFGALIVGTNLYFGWRLETSVRSALASSGHEHREIVRSAEQTTCILALTPDERLRFREDLRPDAWSRWCWWMRRDFGALGGP